MNGGPCKNGGTCQRLGSLGYSCLCAGTFSGYNCEVGATTGNNIQWIYSWFK